MADFDNLQASVTSAVSAATDNVSAAAPESTPDPTPSLATQDAPPPEPVASEEEDAFEFPDEGASPAKPEPVAAEAPTDDPDAQASGITKLTDAEGKPLSWAKLREALFMDPRGHKLFKGFQLARELEKPMDQGGLGGVPSVEALREMHQASQDLSLMVHEFHHGDPSYAQNFVRQWFAPGPNGHSPGAQLAAQSFLSTIQTMANDAQQSPAYRQHASRMYIQAALPAVEGHMEDLYRRGLAEENVERRIALLNTARVMEEDLTGKFRDLPAGIDTAEFAKAQPQVDPRASELDAQVRYINDFKSNQQKQADQAFGQTFNSQITSRLNADVDTALDALSKALPARVFAASKQSFITEVNERMKANPTQLRNFHIARDKARQSRSGQDIKAAADAWISVARPHMKQLRAEYFKDALPQIKAASDARHSILAEAAQKTGTSSVAQPAVRNLAGAPASRQPGETYDEYLHRVTKVAVSAAS